jgi:outer membrane cobalamin receptor
MKKALLFIHLIVLLPVFGQVNTGELHLKIMDPSGRPARAAVTVTSTEYQYSVVLQTDVEGKAVARTLPYGVYSVRTQEPGYDDVSRSIEIHSPVPFECSIQFELAAVSTLVSVEDTGAELDPYRSSSISRIGTEQIADRVASLPGRSVQDLVNSQPGWLYEGNAVLHPRGSEYQTQFVIDGVAFTDNRSPGFGPEIEADDIDSIGIYTAGFPAEYGRKMGGVVEINTKREVNSGLHGQLVLGGGSYATATSFGQLQQIWGKNTLGASASGSMTDHYLNPVVPENFTNDGTTGDFSIRYERDFTDSDRVSLNVRHELSRYEIPNELIQQQAGQLQNGNNLETTGTIIYQHIFSSDLLGNFSGMVRDNADNLYSNASSTPIVAFQHNDFREGYFKGTVSFHHGNQEWKAGLESDAAFLHENFSYNLTDPSQFDDNTPAAFSFTDQRPDLEQSAFLEDGIRFGKWTISAGLRWDHYQLLLNQNAFSPRLSLGHHFPKADMMLHASFDRVFQTPAFENILLSSSAQVSALNPSFLRLPVQPSKGNYYEGGLTKGFAEKARVDINIYRRDVRNYADDDQLLNTGVSYPISFDKSVIYGAEAKLDLLRWGRISGFASYSYMVGNAWFPVTGGLFLGDDVANAETQLTGHFPDSQDQRNTLRTRWRYQVIRSIWFAGGLQSGSGLPFEFEGTQDQALMQYGPQVVNRLNFNRGRVDPLLSIDASFGADLSKSEKCNVHFQVDGDNLNNRLNVIDFGGLFSGNAIGPARSFNVRLTTTF